MDRDMALALIDLLDDIKTAIQTIATNTTPSDDSEPAADAGAGGT